MRFVENIYQQCCKNFILRRKFAVVKVGILIYNGKKIQGYCLLGNFFQGTVTIPMRLYREKQEENLEERISYCH